MCGITGFVGIKSNNIEDTIASMVNIIKHRGPDDNGYCIHENIAIGMTRLSIIDLEGGNQPQHTQDGRFSIVFNGEIYNYPKLKQEYILGGGNLYTNSDTEIILALYEKYRDKCLEKLRGMFAFAILDRKEKSIFIARDRVGIKPLYFYKRNSTFVFGSEIKSLLLSNQFNAEANLSSIADYLTLRYVPGNNGLFKDVERLAPGHWMIWQDGKIKTQCYWKPTIREKARLTIEEFQEQFDDLFQECVDMHKLGNVPHGAYLSGGLDSAAVVAALKNNKDSHLKTFTVGFNWEKDELSEARAAANFMGTDHHEIICKPEDFNLLPEIIWHSDEPLGDPIVLPTYILAKEASKHVKIVLTGEGADEILAGYLFHQAVNLANYYRRFVPQLMHQLFIMPSVNAMPVGILNAGFNYPGYLGNSGKKRLLSFLALARQKNPAKLLSFFISLFDQKEKMSILNEELFSSIVNQEAPEWHASNNGSMLDSVLQMQYVNWLPDNILMRQDKMSMAHSLEARVPFLDHKLIEFMETVPDHLKLQLRKNKILLRNYAAKNGFQKTAKRKKSAFYFPMEEYFGSKTFQSLLAATLSEEAIKNRGLFNYPIVKNMLNRMQGKDFLAAKQVFALVSLELWFQVFIDKKFGYY